MTQDGLFTDCAHGDHAPLLAGPPQDRGECVNVDSTCPACGRLVLVTSWTKAAWIEAQAKRTVKVTES